MTTPNEELALRLFNVVPAASYQMEKLLGLVDIVFSDEVPTAGVQCTRAPTLLLNPAFVEEYCERDGHLLMLVMHELQHVILGHTTLFPRLTLAHNIAFDAVINAMLCRQFPSEADFFRATNTWDEFPHRLLRPAPGWPHEPEPLPGDASDSERELHDLLYNDRDQQVTYHELFELLLGQLDPDQRLTDVVLLGDHGGPGGAGEGDEQAVRDATLRDVLRRIVEGWPPPDQDLSGRDQGRMPRNWALDPAASARAELRRALRRLLVRAGVIQRARGGRRRSTQVEREVAVRTVLPQLNDRRARAWARLHGRPPVLWRGQVQTTRRLSRPQPVAHVYLDISGSMNQALPTLAAALRAPHASGELRLFVFSTVIDEARPGDLARQTFANTGGTRIGCVLEHLEQIPPQKRPRRVVLITDGYVGAVSADTLQALKVSLYVGHYALYGDASVNDLAAVSRHVEVLPSLPGVS